MIRVYLIRNEITGKSYVGQTRQTLYKRWRGHVDRSNNRSTCWVGQLAKDIKQYGQTSFSISLLQECLTQSEADCVEQRFIDALGTKCPGGYNVRDAGQHGKHAAETIVKLKTKVVSDEMRAKLADLQRGRKATPKQLEALKLGWGNHLPQNGRGKHNPNVQLTEVQVREIRELCSTGKLSQFKIADLYGVQQVTVSAIKRRRIWRHLP